jgi:hypothetical protein
MHQFHYTTHTTHQLHYTTHTTHQLHYTTHTSPNVGQNSVVGITIRYGLDGPGVGARFSAPTQPPIQWVPGLSQK